MNLSAPATFTSAFLTELERAAREHGEVHPPQGLDYFIFRRDAFPHQFPPFLFGRYRWDNQLALELLRSDVPVVDATRSILCVHQGIPPRQSGHQLARLGSALNDRLAKARSGESYLLGRVDNAPLVLNGSCSDACELSSRETNAGNFELLALQRADPATRLLVMLTISAAHADLASNWVCWATYVGFNNYVFLTHDADVKRTMEKRGQAVLLIESKKTFTAADYGSLQFQELMTLRTEVILRLLRLNLVVATADIDILWTERLPLEFDWTCDVIGMPHKEVKITGGFVVVQPTAIGREYWRDVVHCQRKNMRTIEDLLKKKAKYDASKYTEQECINDLRPKYNLKFCLLSKASFVDGKAFFEQHGPQLSGNVPMAIHNNWIVGVANKTRRFKENGLMLWNANAAKCELPSAPLVAPQKARTDWQLKLRVLTSSRPASLRRLLASLQSADFSGERAVTLEIVVDKPAPPDDASAAYADTVQVARTAKWEHGSLSVNVFSSHVGIVRMWTDATLEDNELLMVLEDDIEVSPFFAVFLRNAVDRVYANSSQYDPHMFGIMLQRQHTVLGETKATKHRKKKPEDHLEEGVIFYRYQLMSTWGPVYFPKPWKAFKTWLVPHIKNTSYVPCVPALMSNKWAREVGRVWSPYFVRFAYERGLYGLYVSHPLGLSLVTNHKEPGLHFNETKKKSDPITPLVTSDEELRVLMSVPEVSAMPLYDYHMRAVSNTSVLKLRPRYVGIGIDDCHTI